jgi:hypothetical protein
MAMMAITTSNSISVKAGRRPRPALARDLQQFEGEFILTNMYFSA